MCNKQINKVYIYSDQRVITSKPMGKAPAGEGCPRCEGPVYAAEQMLARGRVSTVQ